jgi:hypothetical protein
MSEPRDSVVCYKYAAVLKDEYVVYNLDQRRYCINIEKISLNDLSCKIAKLLTENPTREYLIWKKPNAHPCVGICTTSTGDNICRGCGRTVEQIRDWNQFTQEQKSEILEAIQNGTI